MSSQLVGDRIEYGLREFSGRVNRLNGLTPLPGLYMNAAATVSAAGGMNLPLTLRITGYSSRTVLPRRKKAGLIFWKWKTW
ncbi:hypothetical protein BANRA_05487 [Escherichia coli]|uniref:Uncharacterized protein n=1 Tax=Escherichia coli TaxID=562 RepID=A0A3P5HED2_ECOLX|nr:hypothetical protein BANRA_05487 [Escherichia coli]